MKSKELKSYNLPDNRLYNSSIEAKPVVALSILMIIGFTIMFFGFYIYGIGIFILASFSLLFLPNHKIIEFYDEYMIIYNKARRDECNIVYYDDITSWEYATFMYKDELIISLKDGTLQKVNAFSKKLFEKELNKYKPKKKDKTTKKKEKEDE